MRVGIINDLHLDIDNYVGPDLEQTKASKIDESTAEQIIDLILGKEQDLTLKKKQKSKKINVFDVWEDICLNYSNLLPKKRCFTDLGFYGKESPVSMIEFVID